MNDKQDTETTKQPKPEPESNPIPVTGWKFMANDSRGIGGKTVEDPGIMPPAADTKPVTWSHSEFIAHHKSFRWYALLGLIAIIVAAVDYIYARDVTSVIVIVVAAVILGIVANRLPRTMEYQLDDAGLRIGEKVYGYNDFRSFSMVEEESVPSLVFRPLRRFMPLVIVYYSSKDEQAIMDVLSRHLPLDNHRPDAIDSLMRRIHY
ncbi:MAG TPA: hypothetical protein VMQ52_04625 [Candidatus Saccharimonadales bacterium]|nr:hypothetical protein [Candidatus Saccharimonadales bacterium]